MKFTFITFILDVTTGLPDACTPMTQRRTSKIEKEDKALQRRTQKKTPHSRKIHRWAFVQAKCKTYKLQVLWWNKTVNRQLKLQC